MCVIFVRSEEGGDAYRAAAGDQSVFFSPVQDIHYSETDIPEDYQAVVVTSAQGVKALAGLSADRTTPIICVGEQTAEAAQKESYAAIHIGDGTGASLPDIIDTVCDKASGPVLYARGEKIAVDLGAALSERGFDVIQRVVYYADPHESLSEEVAAALTAGQARLVVFFSAATASHFIRLVEKAGLMRALTPTKALCLGGGMIESIKDLPFAAVIPAAHPSRAALIALIKEQLS